MASRIHRLLLTLSLGLGNLVGVAADAPATVVAVQVQGTVEVQHGQSTETEAVVEGAQLGAADTITTAAKSSVMLVLPSGSVVALKEKSRLKIAVALHSPLAGEALAANETEPRETAASSQTTFELAFGEMLTRVRKLNPTSTFTVQTPVSVAAVRGTVFELAYQPDDKGEANYRLSTASGLVHVTPHAGKMVAVPADEQVEFAAELGKKGIRIKHLKSRKLDRLKKQQIEKEAKDNEHSAGELMQKVQAVRAKAAAERAKAGDPRSTVTARDGKPATPAATNSTTVTNRPTTPASPAARPTTPATKPATPTVKPKVPTPPKTIKRPPRRPGG